MYMIEYASEQATGNISMYKSEVLLSDSKRADSYPNKMLDYKMYEKAS